MPSTLVSKSEDLLLSSSHKNRQQLIAVLACVQTSPISFVAPTKEIGDVCTQLRKELQSGLFPDIWKEALVFSLLKKPGLDVIFKNFRPVNNLSFFPKLIERAAFNQIHGHLVNLYLCRLLIEEITALKQHF